MSVLVARLNPKLRFFRLAYAAFSLFAVYNTLPYFEIVTKHFDWFVKVRSATSSYIVNIVLGAVIAVALILDYKERK